jgi:uncharacterized repeat protein (TIGR01451 family)
MVVNANSGDANGSVITNTVTVSSTTPDPTTGYNAFTVITTVLQPTADLAVTETGPASLLAGNNVSYTITLTNNGPGAAMGVVLTDTLSFVPPFGVFTPGTYTLTPAAGNPDTFTYTVAAGGFSRVETANAPIPSGNVDTFILSGGTLATAPNKSTITDKVSVATTNNDSTPSDDMAAATTTVLQPPPVVTHPSNQTAGEGALGSFNVGSFSDTSVLSNSWTVDANWGDGTPDAMFTTTTQGSLGSVPHTYGEEGTYTVTVTVTSNQTPLSGSAMFQVVVSDPAVLATPVAVNVIAGAACGAGVRIPIATFNDPGGAELNSFDPGPLGNHYKVVSIDWGDGMPLDTVTGSVTFSGTPGSKTDKFSVSGSHTYLTPGTYTITIKLDHETIGTMVMTSATVVDLNKPVQTNQTKPTNWLAGIAGQQMIQSFGLTVGGQTLGQWLASTLPRLFGGVAGAPNLSGFSNAQVASYYVNLFRCSPVLMLDSEVMATAIYVFATTKSLGGNVGLAYGFSVTDPGLGAADQSVNQHGQAFLVPNFTSLNICKILSIANNTALGGHPWGSPPWDTNAVLRNDALAIFLLINQEKWY